MNTRLSVTEIRRNWGTIFDRVKNGETIIVTRRGQAWARLEPHGILLPTEPATYPVEDKKQGTKN